MQRPRTLAPSNSLGVLRSLNQDGATVAERGFGAEVVDDEDDGDDDEEEEVYLGSNKLHQGGEEDVEGEEEGGAGGGGAGITWSASMSPSAQLLLQQHQEFARNRRINQKTRQKARGGTTRNGHHGSNGSLSSLTSSSSSSSSHSKSKSRSPIKQDYVTSKIGRGYSGSSDVTEMKPVIAYVCIVQFDLKVGPCLLCSIPSIDEAESDYGGGGGIGGEGVGTPGGGGSGSKSKLSAQDKEILTGVLPFKVLPEHGGRAPSDNKNGHDVSNVSISSNSHSNSISSSPSAKGAGSTSRKKKASWWLPFQGYKSNIGLESDSGNGHFDKDRCFFLLELAGETLYGAGHFVLLENERTDRGFNQAAVVVLARLPFFGVLQQKLHAFSTEVLHRDDAIVQLEALDASLRSISFDSFGYAAIFDELPIPALVRILGYSVVSLVKLVLLEGRVLIYSKNPATASGAVLALAALLPGVLALGFGHDSPCFGAKAYRWKKFGFPLRIFSGNETDMVLAPLVVMADATTLLQRKGFLMGTSNSMIGKLSMTRLDAFVDVDTGIAKFENTPLAKAANERGGGLLLGGGGAAGDRCHKFVTELLNVLNYQQTAATAAGEGGLVNGYWSAAGGGGSGDLGHTTWKGSRAWVVDQFQLFFEDLVGTAAACLSANEQVAAKRDAQAVQRKHLADEMGGGILGDSYAMIATSSLWLPAAAGGAVSEPPGQMVPVQQALEGFGRAWVDKWVKTRNFRLWTISHNKTIAPADDISSPSTKHTSGRSSGALSGAGLSATGGMGHHRLRSGGGGRGNDEDTEGSSPGGERVGSEWTRTPPEFGLGNVRYENRDTYVGMHERGMRHGKGVYVEHATGNTHEGDWVNDKRHGHGVLTTGAQEYVYDGEWRENVRTGQGQAIYRGIETYKGEFLDGMYHGKGALASQDGSVYEGEFFKNVREGMGKECFANGEMYIGEYKRGQRCGIGQCTYADDSAYNGEWYNGQWHGEGVLTTPIPVALSPSSSSIFSPKSTTYSRRGGDDGDGGDGPHAGLSILSGGVSVSSNGEGLSLKSNDYGAGATWSSRRLKRPGGRRRPRRNSEGDHNDSDQREDTGGEREQEGSGEEEEEEEEALEVDMDVERYEGCFHHGKKHGMGQLRLGRQGPLYEGEWMKGRPRDGTEWHIHYSNGDDYVGAASGFIPHGHGTFKYGMGDIYTGELKNGLRSGQGICIFHNGEIFEGCWENDQISFQGKGTLTLADGTRHDYT